MAPFRILPPSYWNELGGGFIHTPPAETKSFYGNHPPGPCRSKLTVESPRNQGQSHHMHRYADGFPSFPIRTQKRSLPKIILLSGDPAASSEGDPSSSIQLPPLYLLIHLYACQSPPQGWKLRQLAICHLPRQGHCAFPWRTRSAARMPWDPSCQAVGGDSRNVYAGCVDIE